MKHHILLALALTAVFQATPHGQAPPPPKSPFQKLAQPWPSPDEMRQRRIDAETLKLFGGEEPLAFTLAGDFRGVNRDRNPNSKKQFPAQLSVAGAPKPFTVQMSARGHVRRMAQTCDNVPLRLEFDDEEVAGSIFDKQDALKLVVQCRNSGNFEQFVLREYLAYRVLNAITPRSFRARLSKVTYTDHTGKELGSRYGFLLEDDGDVAKRMEGRTVEIPRVLFKDVHTETLDAMMLFEYMIGSTDFSIYALHNVVLVQKPDKGLYTIPYDFDMTGLVSPPYAIPDKRFPITSVKQRMYRGACRTAEEWEPALASFRAQRDKILGIPDSIPDLSKDSREDAKNYLAGFYDSIKDQKDVKRLLVDACQKAPTM